MQINTYPGQYPKQFDNWARITGDHIIFWFLATIEIAINKKSNIKKQWSNDLRGNRMLKSMMSKNLYLLISAAICTYSKINENNQLKQNHPDNAYKVCALLLYVVGNNFHNLP